MPKQICGLCGKKRLTIAGKAECERKHKEVNDIFYRAFQEREESRQKLQTASESKSQKRLSKWR